MVDCGVTAIGVTVTPCLGQMSVTPRSVGGSAAALGCKSWWTSTPEQDAQVRAAFGDALSKARSGELEHWRATPEGTLALVILLDQFSRNIHRGTPQAFAADSQARAVVKQALAEGVDQALPYYGRVFLYMPLEHSEDLDDQLRSVQLFEALVHDAPPGHADEARYFLSFAHKHRDIVARFGRFPHRNPLLGRVHTEEERAWLEEGGETFGQTKTR